MRVLLLSDVPNGWIVARIADRMVQEMHWIEFVRGHYCCMTTAEIVERAADCDLIHAMNWNFADHLPKVLECGKPILISVRSHRYPSSVRERLIDAGVHVHAVNRGVKNEFPRAHYIPDGLMIEPHPLRVGFAGLPSHYKGTHLIEEACKRIKAHYFAAYGDVDCLQMQAWYRNIDVYCCASEAEGFSTPVMEALALNKPVVSVRVGVPWFDSLPGITWVDRNVESISAGLLQHWPSRSLDAYCWRNVVAGLRYGDVCERIDELYRTIA